MTGESSQPNSGTTTTTATTGNKDGAAVTQMGDCGEQTASASPSRARRVAAATEEGAAAEDRGAAAWPPAPTSPTQEQSDLWYGGYLSPPCSPSSSPRKMRSKDPSGQRKLEKARRDVANDANFQSKLEKTAGSSPRPKSPESADNSDSTSAETKELLAVMRTPSGARFVPDDPDSGECEWKKSLAEDVEVQRRYFYGEVSYLEVRVKVGLIIVGFIVAIACVSRLPIGDIRHGMSALLVCGITWQSICQVRELCIPEGVSLLSSFTRRTCIVWLVLVTGVLGTLACFVDSLWHTSTRVYGEELVVLLTVGAAYLVLDLCVLGIFVWGRISAEKLESTLQDQLDAEMDLQLDSVSKQIGDNLERIQKWTYRLSQLVLLFTFCLLYAVPRLIRLIYPFQHGMFSITMGVSLLMLGVMFIEQPEPEYCSLFDEEFHIIRSTSSTVFGSFFLFVGLVLFQPEPAGSQANLLRGAILLSILCCIDVTSILTKTRLSSRSLPMVTEHEE